ncbi:NADPH-dependent F420 reductase [Aureimonas glaciei]|uniref:3-hydroxyisobutyrate dehydrogenase n=1 Tax=Aureimonas glaciei TaxID=1776957 RepID=A0A916Y1G0_9HYPH|nr:NAD(P)-binding domain-containing protein [Aureimonas glaciei]GGD26079.1 3-hydroxyisobutyrate dehydrogenase [Aureimonas glaciei]
MKIGIIGIGNIGGTLARKLVAASHQVRVANSKGAEAVRPFADEIGATATDAQGAVDGVDLVILSIPFPAVANLPKDLFDGLPDSVSVVDTGNYYPGLRDPQIAELDAGKTESVWVTEQIGRPVIKAFNNILAHSLAELGRPAGSPERLAVAVAGDDAAAKQTVMGIANDVGFDAVDGGTLQESWRQQPGTPGYCCDYDAATMRKALAAAVPGEAPAIRDRLLENMSTSGPRLTHDDMIAMNRSANPLN